ncbi:hypothetical protein BLNAU_16519 [Blattamonas nauphoetae]|uniref:Uncharacterized protein n=1 Tax=Blattamonas nauphoetae TaxID=2049346 RepID=A0ABQ9X880_9EUKA|nr:hypothetical protein BLNAU_16519 [Blattamonas nauphoetae]
MFSLLAIASASAQFLGYGGLGMGGYGMGGYGMGGYGMSSSYGGYGMGGFGGGYGGFGVLSGDDLSDEELYELCYSDSYYCPGCYSDCSELCGCFPSNIFSGCGVPCQQGCNFNFPTFNSQCGSPCGTNFAGFGSQCAAPCGMNSGFSQYAPAQQFAPAQQCAPVYRQAPVQICQAPTPVTRSAGVLGGQASRYNNGQNCNAYGTGACGADYNNGAVCGSANSARLNAMACQRSGNRAFADKCSDEFLIRRSNEHCATGDDHYSQASANLNANNRQIAGNSACGAAHQNHCNAAGMNNRNCGNCANIQGGAMRSCATGNQCAAPVSYAAPCAAPVSYAAPCAMPCGC